MSHCVFRLTKGTLIQKNGKLPKVPLTSQRHITVRSFDHKQSRSFASLPAVREHMRLIWRRQHLTTRLRGSFCACSVDMADSQRTAVCAPCACVRMCMRKSICSLHRKMRDLSSISSAQIPAPLIFQMINDGLTKQALDKC